MCGIAGILSNTNNTDQCKKNLHAMLDSMKHRGPDDEGVWNNDRVFLGHRRLSIIDLSGGHQPMIDRISQNIIVFNGEIFNFQDIRNDLIKSGDTFDSSSDTEVILKAYARWGAKCLDRFNGMFVFTIWDNKKNELFIARDRLGVKPLYYSFTDKHFIFSSEFTPIQHVLDKTSINQEAFLDYMNYMYVPTPISIVNEIKKFPQAHYAIIREGKITFTKYWEPWETEVNNLLNENDLKEELNFLLNDATKIRMISDVPLGAFLSGGIDSTVVVSRMAHLSNHPVKTFTIGFENDKNSEIGYARDTAALYQTDHHEEIISPIDVPDLVNNLCMNFGEPFADSSSVPTYFVSKLARKYVTVALSGDGGDELFAGYNSYRYYKKLYEYKNKYSAFTRVGSLIGNAIPDRVSKKISLVRKYKNFIDKYNYCDKQQWSISRGILSRGESVTALNPVYRHKFIEKNWYTHIGEYFNRLQKLDIVDRLCRVDMQSYLPDDLLVKVDRMSMAASLEVRSPFLDYRLVEFSLKVPNKYKLNNNEGKLILKSVMDSQISKELIRRKKQGFTMPLQHWFKSSLFDYACDTLLNGKAIDTFFDKKGVEKILKQHKSGTSVYESLIWTMIIFEKWLGRVRNKP